MTERGPYVRSFNQVELLQIKELKDFMSSAFNVESWNLLRDEAKCLWPEKIISAVDGLRKWLVRYDKPSKSVIYMGVKL